MRRAEGVVVGALPNDFFKVKLADSGQVVLAQRTGKLRFIRVVDGDRVTVELSASDPSRGRITSCCGKDR